MERKKRLDLISPVNQLSRRFCPKKLTGNRFQHFRLRPVWQSSLVNLFTRDRLRAPAAGLLASVLA
jgi:hypothetical protein